MILPFSNSAYSQAIKIIELHQNNASGVPELYDQIVTVSGEVTVADQFGISSFIEDETAGVAVYDGNFANSVAVGDFVTISGRVDQFRGLTELKDVTILEHVPKTASIEPKIITCLDIAEEGTNGVENLEGELVRINNVTVNTTVWDVIGSGGNYILTDETGSCTIRIDSDTDIANTVAPGDSAFDVIGVVSQYDPESPYVDGYQLMPRWGEDIIFLSGPRFISEPEEDNITSTSMMIHWQTATLSNSILMYGETINYEIDTLIVDEFVTFHQLALSGLLPATVYHVKVGSGDETGTNYSGDHIVITGSDPSSTGEMNVYFTRNVDYSFSSPGNEANASENLAQHFIDRVNAANYSIDICIYSWDLTNVTDAVINAFNRGVKVRFIHDYDHGYQSQVQRLKQAGIPVIDQGFSQYFSNGAQHNKFAIFDARDDAYSSDDWVWTGSINLTAYNELGINGIQNAIEIQDQSLARSYTMEFDEMWGSSNDSPNASLSRFGSYKSDNIPHKFIINGAPIELYMCPSDRATSKIIEQINTADHEIYFCILAFTRYDVAQAMYQKFTSLPGFAVRGVFDDGQSSGSQWFSLNGTGDYPWNPPADVWLDHEYGVLHHKYMIIDAHHEYSDPIVISGSQNWSTSAETKNDENILIIHNAEIANQYLQEFAARYHAAGGSSQLTSVGETEHPSIVNIYEVNQNFPNPFNSVTRIQFKLGISCETELLIFNIKGELVRNFDFGLLQPGRYGWTWDGKNNDGKGVSSGIYLYYLNVKDKKFKTQSQKMIYLP